MISKRDLLSLITLTHHFICNRYRKRKNGALAEFGLGSDGSAVQLDELARDVEAEARALLAARDAGAGLLILVEESLGVFGRDADAVVRHRDARQAA